MGTWETSSRCGSPRTKIRSGCVIASVAIRLGQMLAHSIKASRKGMEEAEAKLVKWHHSRPVACPETRTFLFVSSWNKLSEPPSPIERQRWRPNKRALPHIRHSCIPRCDQTMKLRSPGLYIQHDKPITKMGNSGRMGKGDAIRLGCCDVVCG